MVNMLTVDLVRLFTNLAFITHEEWYMAEILRTASYGDRTVKLYFSNHNERSEAELRLISYGFEVTQTPFSALRVSW